MEYRQSKTRSAARLVAVVLAAVAVHPAASRAAFAEDYRADALWLQAGSAPQSTMVAVGATWDLSWRHHSKLGVFTAYLESIVGRWDNDADPEGGSSDTTQVGITPVLRLFPSRGPRAWFVEAGIGANLLMPLYRTSSRQFSTVFNFGDHLGIGRTLGPERHREVVLRLQHFSNASIERPNPGQNFLEVRYAWRH
jgi:hypothetical protein